MPKLNCFCGQRFDFFLHLFNIGHEAPKPQPFHLIFLVVVEFSAFELVAEREDALFAKQLFLVGSAPFAPARAPRRHALCKCRVGMPAWRWWPWRGRLRGCRFREHCVQTRGIRVFAAARPCSSPQSCSRRAEPYPKMTRSRWANRA